MLRKHGTGRAQQCSEVPNLELDKSLPKSSQSITLRIPMHSTTRKSHSPHCAGFTNYPDDLEYKV